MLTIMWIISKPSPRMLFKSRPFSIENILTITGILDFVAWLVSPEFTFVIHIEPIFHFGIKPGRRVVAYGYPQVARYKVNIEKQVKYQLYKV